MANSIPTLLDSTRLLFDLQRVNHIVQKISGCLSPELIARQITEALVDHFGCAFARIWLTEPDQSSLRLVASAGLYTHLDGSFARVPMGAYKVGKIAQNRVPFLSNQLADEPWVKDRNWAIANSIKGFAGYPLAAGDRVIGVLATFSRERMAAEFLEVLQVLCMTATVSLDAALQTQRSPAQTTSTASSMALSDQLAHTLSAARFTLVGTEQPLNTDSTHLFLQAAESLSQLSCHYCRLTYAAETVVLEAIAKMPEASATTVEAWLRSHFGKLRFEATHLGGTLQTQPRLEQNILSFLLTLPYPNCRIGPPVRIDCQPLLLHTAITHLAHLAGLSVCDPTHPAPLLITNKSEYLLTTAQIIWIRPSPTPVPSTVSATIDWSIEPAALHTLVHQISQGASVAVPARQPPPLSSREQEIMALLAQGLRDRSIAQQLFISESTVKFHINNSLSKLNAKNRYQAVYQAAINGWI
ncbi:LuxR C-terminal-related transcriptional regulator [Almyronema epifaneia]|uniref:LuxR C-terminal-related transcriptional regulator n=1 Tax=Almyronema epifaneia S1 TaxID=2991925 RepID=A0ABW6IDK6_9CYAN